LAWRAGLLRERGFCCHGEYAETLKRCFFQCNQSAAHSSGG
jgi:transcriptional regulator GlxA family with amidase domain